jgi:hypothetical protein
MANFNYSWKVTEANETTKNMLVEYSLEGYQTFLVGMPMPTEAVTLEQRVQQYAPVPQWEFSMLTPVSVEIGASGSSSFTVAEPFSNNVPPTPATPS